VENIKNQRNRGTSSHEFDFGGRTTTVKEAKKNNTILAKRGARGGICRFEGPTGSKSVPPENEIKSVGGASPHQKRSNPTN